MPPTRRRGRDTKVFYTPKNANGALVPALRVELTGKLRGFDGLQQWGSTAERIPIGGGGGLTGSINSGYKRYSPTLTIDDNPDVRRQFFASAGRDGQLEVAPENSTAAGKRKETLDVNITQYRHSAPERGKRRFSLTMGATGTLTKSVYT